MENYKFSIISCLTWVCLQDTNVLRQRPFSPCGGPVLRSGAVNCVAARQENELPVMLVTTVLRYLQQAVTLQHSQAVERCTGPPAVWPGSSTRTWPQCWHWPAGRRNSSDSLEHIFRNQQRQSVVCLTLNLVHDLLPSPSALVPGLCKYEKTSWR